MISIRNILATLAISFATTDTAFASQEIVESGSPHIDISMSPVSSHPGRWLLGSHALWPDVQDSLLNSTGIGGIDPLVHDWLKKTAGVIRYSTGANLPYLKACLGDIGSRPEIKPNKWSRETNCRFGVGEYISLVRTFGEHVTWLVANPAKNSKGDTNLTAVASEASELAGIVAKLGEKTRYWELGNELERGEYKWAPDFEAVRSSAVATAIASSDPEAKIILPLIEFDARWQPKRSVFNETLLKTFSGPLTGISLHLYYDAKPLPPVSANLAKVTDSANLYRKIIGKPAEVWITEHARWPEGDTSDSDWKENWYQTNNVEGMLSTGDFLIGLSQIEDVTGAMVHGLRAGPWNVFDKSASGLSLTGIGKLYAALASVPNDIRLKTNSYSLNKSGYKGGYDIRGAGFTDASGMRLGVWLLNRSSTSVKVPIKIDGGGKAAEFVRGVSVVCDNPADETDCPSKNIQQLPVTASQVSTDPLGKTVDMPAKSVVALEFFVK